MSLEAEAQSTTEETNSCSSYSLEKVVNLVKMNALKLEENAEKMEKIASNQKQNAKELKVMKELFAANSSGFEEVVNEVRVIAKELKKIALSQQQNAKELKIMKELMATNSSGFEEVANEVRVINKEIQKIASNREVFTANFSLLEAIANVVKSIATSQQDIKELVAAKRCELRTNSSMFLIAENSSAFWDVANMFSVIALRQQQNTNEIKNVKDLLVGNSSVLEKVAKGIASNQQGNCRLKPCLFDTLEHSKQALVSALQGEYLTSFFIKHKPNSRCFYNKLEKRYMERGISHCCALFCSNSSFFNCVGQQGYHSYHILGHVTSPVT